MFLAFLKISIKFSILIIQKPAFFRFTSFFERILIVHIFRKGGSREVQKWFKLLSLDCLN